ncbi:MAG: DUF177 domain-containing protein [Pseudomonadota bacterium]
MSKEDQAPTLPEGAVPYSHRLPLLQLGKKNRAFEVKIGADEGARAQVAAAFGLVSVTQLDLTGILSPWRREGWRLEGDLRAQVAQACVVTLDPVPEGIDTTLTRFWLPEERLDMPEPNKEIEIVLEDALDGEEIEPLGQGIDLGAVAVEALLLHLDPYPHSPSAKEEDAAEAVVGTDVTDDDAGEHPFAGLAALRATLADRE